MKAVILGGTGFLGASVCHALARNDWEIVSVARREPAPGHLPKGVRFLGLALPDPTLCGLLTAFAPGAIVFCTGSPTVGAAQGNPANEIRLSVAAAQCALEALREWGGPCRFILVSSAAVYGEGQGRTLDETSAKAPISFYGYSKLMSETLVESYRAQFGIDGICLRPFSVFGENQKKQVVFDLATRMLACPSEIEIAGTGLEARDFVLIDDFAAIVGKVAHGAKTGGALNIGTGQATTLAELAQEIGNRLAPDIAIRFSGTPVPRNPLSLVAGTAEAQRLGLRAPSRLAEGLNRYCNHLLRQAGGVS